MHLHYGMHDFVYVYVVAMCHVCLFVGLFVFVFSYVCFFFIFTFCCCYCCYCFVLTCFGNEQLLCRSSMGTLFTSLRLRYRTAYRGT